MNKKVNDLILFQSIRNSFIPNLRVGSRRASTSVILPKIFRLINKKLYKFGVGVALNRYDNSYVFYSGKKDAALYANYKPNEVYCNFGSGAFFHKKWLNYDYPAQSKYYKALQGDVGIDFFGIDLCVDDLTLPHADNSVSLIYCAHTLEHLEERFGKKFLMECKRILKNGGIMRIVVPSTDNDFRIASIVNQQGFSQNIKKHVCAQVASHLLSDTAAFSLEETYTLMAKSNFSASSFFEKAIKNGASQSFSPKRPEMHISFWDYNKLLSMSKEVGFEFCIPCYKGTSQAKPFLNTNVFDTTESQISLYVELVK